MTETSEASAFQMVMTFATAFALWGSDLYILMGPQYAGSDNGFYTAMTIAFLLFVIEFAYNITYKSKYIFSFYFYIDFISAISLLPEVCLMFGYNLFDGSSSAEKAQQSGLAARAGFRTGRIVRVLRIFKMVRIFKILAIFSRSLARGKSQTVLGTLIHTQLQQKMVLLIVALLLLVGILEAVTDVDSLIPSVVSWESELQKLVVLHEASSFRLEEPFLSSVQYFVFRFNCENPLTGATGVPSMATVTPWDVRGYIAVWFNGTSNPAEWCFMRSGCAAIAAPDDLGRRFFNGYTSGSLLDTTKCRLKFLRVSGNDIFGYGPSRLTWMRQLRSIGFTESIVAYLDTDATYKDGICPYKNLPPKRVAIAEVLEMGTLTNAYNGTMGDPCSMVISDIAYSVKATSLVTFLNIIFLVILLSFSDQTLSRMILLLVVEPIGQMTAMVKGLAENPMMKLTIADLPGASTETRMVAKALVQLSAMLQIAFGEAGAHIISHNIQSVDSINALVPGRRIRGIFGFCDVRRFTDCTECFLAEVLVFMNRIADYAHTSVVENMGHPTLNLGDAFQFAWIVPEGNYGMVGESASDAKAQIADAALRSFLRVVIETSTDPYLIRMSANEQLQERVKGYIASSGFGLHSGWAIQGAIGSEAKIDAIYMSSHVKWAERLEGATKYYGVMLLMTDSFYDLLSPDVQSKCRRVDRIKVVDNPAPIDLYTYDITAFSLVHLDASKSRSGLEKILDFFDAFPPKTSTEWRQTFRRGLGYFLDGEWEAAQATFDECLAVHPDDGPTKVNRRLPLLTLHPLSPPLPSSLSLSHPLTPGAPSMCLPVWTGHHI